MLPKDQTFTLDFMDNTGIPNGTLSFSTQNKGFIEWNKQNDFSTVHEMLLLHFQKGFRETFEKYKISPARPTHYILFQNLIMDLAILNNYQITFTETNSVNGLYLFTVFLYKQDK